MVENHGLVDHPIRFPHGVGANCENHDSLTKLYLPWGQYGDFDHDCEENVISTTELVGEARLDAPASEKAYEDKVSQPIHVLNG